MSSLIAVTNTPFPSPPQEGGHFENLPSDLLIYIFSSFVAGAKDDKDIIKAGEVCKAWKNDEPFKKFREKRIDDIFCRTYPLDLVKAFKEAKMPLHTVPIFKPQGNQLSNYTDLAFMKTILANRPEPVMRFPTDCYGSSIYLKTKINPKLSLSVDIDSVCRLIKAIRCTRVEDFPSSRYLYPITLVMVLTLVSLPLIKDIFSMLVNTEEILKISGRQDVFSSDLTKNVQQPAPYFMTPSPPLEKWMFRHMSQCHSDSFKQGLRATSCSCCINSSDNVQILVSPEIIKSFLDGTDPDFTLASETGIARNRVTTLGIAIAAIGMRGDLPHWIVVGQLITMLALMFLPQKQLAHK